MSSATTTPVTPDPTGVSGSWTPDPAVATHPLWQRVKDAVELPADQYDQKYAADDAKIQDKINGVLGHLVPFYKEVSATQPAIEKTKLGKQTAEFVKDQLAHPEQFALGGEFGGETVPGAAIEGAAKIGEHLKETGKTAAKAAVEEGKSAIAAKAPIGSAEAGSVGGAGTAPAKDFSSVGGVKVERRAPDSPFRTPGTTMKKVADQSYAAMREHGIDTTPAPVETKLEEPSGKFAPVGGVEQRAATTFGRTGGSFGRTVDQTYDVLRAQDKPADENLGGTDYGAVIGPSKKAAKEAVEALAEHDAPEIANQVESKVTGRKYIEGRIHPDDFAAGDKLPADGGYYVHPDGQIEEAPTHLSVAMKHMDEVPLKERNLSSPVTQYLSRSGAARVSYYGNDAIAVETEQPLTDSQTQQIADFSRKHGLEVNYDLQGKTGDAGNYLQFVRAVKDQQTPAIHPDLQKLSDKYGVSDDPEKVRNGASFIRPDGKFVHLPAGTEHPDAIRRTLGVSATGSRENIIADTGVIRSRFHLGRNGQTLSFSVPEKGVTPEQIQALKDGFRTSMDGGRGNLVMEIGTPNGKSTQADYVTANEIEPALARIGAMPNQRVNLSDAYGDTGKYLGGHNYGAVIGPSDESAKEAVKALAEHGTGTTVDPWNKIVDLHNENGGATWNLAQNKNLSGTDNYAVSTHPDRTLPVKGELTPEIVKSFAEKNADLLKDPTESLGTWNDKANNQHVLDVVKTIPDRAEAVRLGFENKQDAIFHLKGEGKEIFMKDEKPPETFNTEGWLTKDGEFHPNASGEGHQQTASKLGHGDAYYSVENSLKAGNVRVVTPKVGQVWFHAAEDNPTTRDLISKAIDNASGLSRVGVEFSNDPKGLRSFDRVSPDDAVKFLKNPDSLTQVSRWRSEEEPEDSRGVVFGANPLPEDYQAKVAAIRQTHGDDAAFNELAQTLPPEQRKAVGKVMRRNILDAFAELPQGIEEDATEAAKAGAIQKGWYQHTATLIKSIFGGDTKLFSNILAALSPLKGVRENFIAALNFYADWHAAGRPTSGKVLRSLTTDSFMKAYSINLIRAVNGEDISGPKVSQFAKNVRGYLDAITNDRWMQFFTGNAKAWSDSKMAASDIVMRRVAQKLGWKPAEVQETLWSFVKPVVELSEKEGVSPSEKAKTITDTEIRESAPSFANLLSDPIVREAFGKIADATGDERFRPSRIEGSRSFKRVQKSTPTPTGKPVGGPADVLGRVGERTAATRTKYLNKGIAKLGEEREPGDEN